MGTASYKRKSFWKLGHRTRFSAHTSRTTDQKREVGFVKGTLKRLQRELKEALGYFTCALAVLCTLVSSAHAFEAGVCEFDDPDDAFRAVNTAIMTNPSKYNAIDTNGNSIADSLESEHHAQSGGTLFGNYMCSEFAALFICVLHEEYNCSDEDVKMATGPAINGGGRHAVTGLSERILKSNGGNQPVDGYVHVDTSWPDYNNNHLQYRDGGGSSVRDGLFNAAPQQCANGYSVARGTGGGGMFGSGGGAQMATQWLLSNMMKGLMNRMGQKKKKPPLVQQAYDAMERRKQIAAAYTANAQISATNAAQEEAARAVPTVEPTPTPTPQPIPEPEVASRSSVGDVSSVRAKLNESAGGGFGAELPPDPALR